MSVFRAFIITKIGLQYQTITKNGYMRYMSGLIQIQKRGFEMSNSEASRGLPVQSKLTCRKVDGL